MLLLAAALSMQAQAQTVSSFEALSLPHADTFYVNYSASGTDVGFDDGFAHFPCVYDTSWGGLWSYGFAYSNMTDSVTSGYGNQYAAKTAIGHGGSANYAVAYCYNPVTFANTVTVHLTDTAIGHPVKGAYITNSTYAFNSMRDGDWAARAFRNGDWFMLTARAYFNGVLGTDSVGIYLANFLHPDTADNYILNTWEWFDLSPLGKADSIEFTLRSTDNGAFGMNTPAYFCMDDFTTWDTYDTTTPPLTVITQPKAADIRLYPVPASTQLYVDVQDASGGDLFITNMSGSIVMRKEDLSAHNELYIASLPAGQYTITVRNKGKVATSRFSKL